MPAYEYKCPECSQILERVNSMENRDNCPTCIDCDKVTKRIISKSVGAIFVGQGWGRDA